MLCMPRVSHMSDLSQRTTGLRDNTHKLVRDRIPEIIERDGRAYAVEPMQAGEYRQALSQKLVEEAQEAAMAQPPDLVIELADLLEVVDTLLAEAGITEAMVREVQQRRRVERGGFAQRLKLLWVDEG